MLRKKNKKELERVEFEEEEDEEEFETEEGSPGEPPMSELPALPPRTVRRKAPEPKPSVPSASEYADMVEGDIKRAYIALLDFRKRYNI